MRGTWAITIGGESFCTTDDVVSAAAVQGGPQVEQVNLCQGPAPLFLNLLNTALTRRWQITRQWSSNADALAFWHDAGAIWGGVADVVLQHTDYSGDTASIQITGARVDVSVDMPIGVTTVANLTVTGGATSIPAT
jgi:hypothetical protein